MQNNVEQIKERLDIVDVVGAYLKLEKAGVNFKTCCPFHNEKTPSFLVSPVRGTYHCFGCNKGGDIFSFVEEMEGIDFKGALKILADRAGVQLEYQNPEKQKESDRLYSVLETVTHFYQVNLTKNKDALAYLYGRGLNAETLKAFRVGFAKDSWEDCYESLKSKGYSDKEIGDVGMSVKKQDGNAAGRNYYDRFRSRIMFPISDSAGRVVAFSGRIFGKEDDKMGKYVNSPETSLFHKSNILFGYDKAKAHMRKENTCVLVEGQMDTIMAHQAGTENAVAVSGTAFTEAHARMINRIVDTLILALDADPAGLAATQKSALVALREGLDVRVAVLPEGKDPADLILENPEAWNDSLVSAQHVINFYLSILEKQFPDARTFKLEAAKQVLPLVKQINNKIDQSHFISEVSRKLAMSEDVIKDELQKIQQQDSSAQAVAPIGNNTGDINTKNRKEIIQKNIFGILLWQESDKDTDIHIDELKKRLREIIGDGVYGALEQISDKDKQKLSFEAERHVGTGNITSEIDELFANLSLEILQDKRKALSLELQEAELAGDSDKSKELLKELQKISEEISNIKG
ncbi:DNA primase [Patescibacteria group bacterium]